MGCHTWSYTPANIPEKEEIKNFLFDLYEDYLQSFKDRWKNIIKNNNYNKFPGKYTLEGRINKRK